MTDFSNGRVSMYLKVAPEFKAKVAKWAEAQGLSITDAVVKEISAAIKMSEIFAPTPESQDDWEQLAREARDRRG